MQPIDGQREYIKQTKLVKLADNVYDKIELKAVNNSSTLTRLPS